MTTTTGNRMRAATFALLALGASAGARAGMSVDEALAVDVYPAPPDTPDRVLIRNATVWTMAGAGILAGTDVLVENGRIARIGKALADPGGALVIDATGRHVTPGIVDAHSHSAGEDMGFNEGVRSVSAEVRIRDLLDPSSAEIYLQLAGGVTTVHVLHGSANSIGGQNAIIKYRWRSKTPEELLFEGAPPTIKFALGENPTQVAFRSPTAAFTGDNGELRYPATRMGVSALIRTSFEEAARYRDTWARYNALSKRQQRREVPPRRDLQLDALVEVLDGKRGVHAHSYRADEILMLIRLAEELGIRISTFQHVLEGYRVADEMAAHGAAGSTFSDWWSFKLEAFHAIPYNAALMRARGVLTSLNSDSDSLARYLNIEAAKTVRYGGLAPADAFALVTINPAKQLGIDDRVGSLEAGKDADLVIWSGDPLSVYSVADETFVDGRLRFSRALDREHRAEVEAARQTLLGELRGDEASSSDDAGESDAEPAATPQPVVLPEYRFAPDHMTGPIAITGAMVHTLEGPAIANGVVVMEDGRITAVGGPATPVPAGAERVAAAGKHLWPAMIHTNTILGINEIDSIPASSDIAETGDINADADVVVAVNAASTHFPVVRSAGISHAVIVPAGGMVSGTTAVLRTDGWTWEEMAAVERHGLALRWPDPIPPQYAGLIGMEQTLAERRKESDELVERIEKLLDAAAAYGLAGPDADFDPQLHALQPVLRGERPLWAWAREKHAIEAAVGLARKRGIRVVIVGGRDAYLLTELLAENRVPVVLTDITAEPPRHDDPYDVLYTMPAKLEAAGVVFALANGTRAGGSANGRQITVLAGIAAAHGLDRESAYRSVTTYPARILGLDNVLGTIAAGKSASLVLTDGDLLEQTTTVEQVWIDGQAADMDDVQKAAYRHWSSRPLPDES